MLEEALAALASAGGTALVSAMVTDGWEGVRNRVARLLGRGDPSATGVAVARLDDSRVLVRVRSGTDLAQTMTEQAVVWRTRLADLLEDCPEAEEELHAIVAAAQALVIGSAGPVRQSVSGSGYAQQAVQGHGTQVNTFGGHDEPGSLR